MDVKALLSLLTLVAPSAVTMLEPHLKKRGNIDDRQLTLVMIGTLIEQNTRLERVLGKLGEIEGLNSKKLDQLLERPL